jgi:hypothetical protein
MKTKSKSSSPKASPFIYVESINTTKQNLMKNSANDILAEKSYVPFMTNRSLSYHADTIGYANVMNIHSGTLSYLPQYEYFLHAVRSRKRFSPKWAKAETDADLDAIRECFSVSYRRAQTIRRVLTSEQMRDIHDLLMKGGVS